ncbi:MAG TPA: hypothetical protein VIR01_18800 [Pyrinomonadaceae bacterium]
MIEKIKFLVLAPTLLLTTIVALGQDVEIKRTFDEQQNLSTIRLPATPIAYEQRKYHRLDLSLSYSFKGTTPPSNREKVVLELVSVVKARQLNSDLYVVFLVDGKSVHFGSSRSAIMKPVPGRLWIGERMVFSLPYQEFVKLSSAKKLAIRFGDTTFQLTDATVALLSKFASEL